MITLTLAAELFRLASLYSGLPALGPPPAILERSRAELCRYVGRTRCDLAGTYNAGDHFILIARSHPDRNTVAVHEMVHYLQWQNGLLPTRSCAEAQRLEDQAVGVSDRYSGYATHPDPREVFNPPCRIVYDSARGAAALARVALPPRLPVPSSSGGWTYLTETEHGDRIFFLRSSIQRKGHFIAARFKTEYARLQYEEYGTYDSTFMSLAFDCARRTRALRQAVDKRNGAVVHQVDLKEPRWEFEHYPPGSIGAAQMRAVCGMYP
jgi:surface-adhesin protein E